MTGFGSMQIQLHGRQCLMWLSVVYSSTPESSQAADLTLQQWQQQAQADLSLDSSAVFVSCSGAASTAARLSIANQQPDNNTNHSG
jgi:hypothetical protein